MSTRPLVARLTAEFGIIVLGVLVALWADAWVDRRSDRAVEQARLEALRDDVTRTLADVREERDMAEQANDALVLLLPEHTADASPDTLGARLGWLMYGPAFYPEVAAYEDLKSSGELGLLSDPELRRSLSTMDARAERFRLLQEDHTTVQQVTIDRAVLENLAYRPIGARFLDSLEPAGEPVAGDFAFAHTRAFENVVVMKLDLVGQLEEALLRLEEALQAVEARLPDAAQ